MSAIVRAKTLRTLIRFSIAYLGSATVVVGLGLASRRYGAHLPPFLATYAGDTLWALLVFLGISALAPHARLRYRSGFALAISYLVEVSQLYHAPWIDAIRQTALGGLVLGFGFLRTDLVCYTAGIALGAAVDGALRSRRSPGQRMSASEGGD